jgi:hypothetical protein
MWADTDVVANRGLEFGDSPFLVSQRNKKPAWKVALKTILRKPESVTINNNVIFKPDPRSVDLISLAEAYSAAFPKEKIIWGELGPLLVTAIESIFPEHNYSIMPASFANPFDWWNCPDILLRPGIKIPRDCKFIHLWNERWRLAGKSKDGPYPPGSVMAKLDGAYGY